MPIRIIREPITRMELKQIAEERFGDMVKGVVDVDKGLLGLGGELHADIESVFVESEGSKREHTWGINLYPDQSGDDFLEYDSLVNIKPSFGNRTRGVEDAVIREKISKIVGECIVL